MKTLHPGWSSLTGQHGFPQDSTLYRELDCWQLRISKKEQCLIIDSTDYHPGLLFLTKEDLQRAIEVLSD